MKHTLNTEKISNLPHVHVWQKACIANLTILSGYIKEEIHTRILKNLKEREIYSLQNSAKIIKIG